MFQKVNNRLLLWQCDVFIYVSCAQTALLDSKEYLAPVITPFEAMIAFNRYCIEFGHAYRLLHWFIFSIFLHLVLNHFPSN